ncbi:MAG TPA: arylamine N-acetyltransferase, partial [Parvularculaceae bacterium]|nr:arylamine N-acetyltransferase [Parvularculaceae bacterium]
DADADVDADGDADADVDEPEPIWPPWGARPSWTSTDPGYSTGAVLVDIDGAPWIADVGFGGGLVDPVPLRVGAVDANPLGCRLDAIDGGWWRFTEDARMGGMSYDFNPAVDDEALLEKQCRFLQTDAASPFVQNAVAQRWIGEAHYSLRGRVLRILTPREEKKSIVATADAYVETLRETFGVDLPEAARLWPAICIRHEEVFGTEKAI